MWKYAIIPAYNFSQCCDYGTDGKTDEARFGSRHKRYFSLPKRPHRLSNHTQPPIQLKPTVRSPEVKQTGCESKHSSPFGAEVNARSCTTTPTCAITQSNSITYRQILNLYKHASSIMRNFWMLKHSAIHFNAKYEFSPQLGTLYSTDT